MSRKHWRILDLDSSSATARDIKRAYAQRLKLCRPDRDPEGFQALHHAYTTALRELEWRQSSQSQFAPHFLPEPEPPQLVSETLQTPATSHIADLPAGRLAMAEIFDRLAADLESNGTDIAPLVRQAEALLYLHPTEVHYWGQTISQLIQQYGDHAQLSFKSEALLFELENEGTAATLAVIERFDRQGQRDAVRGFSYLFIGQEKRIANPAAGLAACRLACAAAMWEPSFVKQLADFAYRNLALDERDIYMLQLDSARAKAATYAHIPDACKWFWLDRLQNPPPPESWDSAESQKAIRFLKSRDAIHWPCFLEIVRLLPQHLADVIMASHKLPMLLSDPNPELALYKANNRHLSGPVWTKLLPSFIGSNFVFLWCMSCIAKPFKWIGRSIYAPKAKIPGQRSFRLRPAFWMIFVIVKLLVLIPHCNSN